LYKGSWFINTCLHVDMADNGDGAQTYYKAGWVRKWFRIASFLMHVVIAALAIFFYNHKMDPIKRSELVKHDWKYIEFIERIYNNRVEKGEYTLEMLGTDAVYKKGFKSDTVYFDSKKTASEIFQFSMADNGAILVRSFFDDISSLIEGASFASPLYLYKKNAQIYGLPGHLCDRSAVHVTGVWERNLILGSKPPDNIDRFTRFCKPNIAPSVDYAYCFSAIQKHQYILLVLGVCTGIFALLIPCLYAGMHMFKKDKNKNAIMKFAIAFHFFEDMHTFVDSIALVAFIMEVVEGFPSGFENTRCPQSATALYTVYMMFNTIFVFLCALTCISILTWILDFSIDDTEYTKEVDARERVCVWNTRHDEVHSTEVYKAKYTKLKDSEEDEEGGATEDETQGR